MVQALAVNQIIKAQLWTQDSEQAAVNTFHYFVSVITATAPNLDDFASAWAAAVVAQYKLCINNNALYQGCLVQVVSPPPLRVAATNNDLAGAGGGLGAGLPRQVAGFLSWRTSLAGPGGRGRTYVPFPSDADTELNGIPTDAYIGLLLDFGVAAVNFVNVPGGTGSATVVMGLREKNTANFTPFEDVINPKKFATQKRRGSFGRANNSPF